MFGICLKKDPLCIKVIGSGNRKQFYFCYNYIVLTKIIIENVLIILGEGFWVISAFSQLRHLLKTKDRKGLYAPNQTINAAGNIAWITYFNSRHLYLPMASNAALFLLTMTIMFYTLKNQKQFIRGLFAIIIVGPLTSYLLIKHPHISGWVGATYNIIASLPWLIHVIRTKKTSGISGRSLVFVYGALACVLAYAVLIISAPLLFGVGSALISTLIITKYYFSYRDVGKEKIRINEEAIS